MSAALPDVAAGHPLKWPQYAVERKARKLARTAVIILDGGYRGLRNRLSIIRTAMRVFQIPEHQRHRTLVSKFLK